MRALPRNGGLLTNSKPTRERIRRPRLDELAELLEASIGKRPRSDRLDRDDRALSWCVRKANAEGNPFRTTYTQAAAGMGYPVTGDRHSDFQRFGNNVYRALNSLEDAGLIRWGGIKRANGQWRCLEVEVIEPCSVRSISLAKEPDNGCQPGRRRFVRRPLTAGERVRPHRPPASRRVFFTSDERSYPFGVPPHYVRGNLREPTRAREGPAPPRSETDNGKNGSMESTTGRTGDADRDALLDGFAAAYGRPARFSHRRWGARLDRALQRLDRYADGGKGRRGAGVELALVLIRADAADEGDPLGLSAAPGSLAYWVPVLDSISKDWRRAQKPRLRAARRHKMQERATGARSASPPAARLGRGRG